MRRSLHIVLALLLLFSPAFSSAQNHVRRAMEKARQRQQAMARAQVDSESAAHAEGGKMRMQVIQGDTTYLDQIPAVYFFGRGKRGSEQSWRDYYRLVWRFARVYPYALASAQLVRQVDSTLNAEHYGFIRKERYISAIQKQLFKDFERSFRDMSIQQGTVLLKLIDRETGITPYELIKNYKSGVAAGFWQGVAKLFDNDLKSSYDPAGSDRQLEELVQVWQRGEFRDLYWSVFWEDPPEIKLPSRYKL